MAEGKVKRSNLFQKFVQIGRVVRILDGPDRTKLAVIVEIVDHRRVLVDGPTTGVARQCINLKHVDLTRYRVKTSRDAPTGRLRKDIAKRDFLPLWNKSETARTVEAGKQKANMTDFEHFKASVLRKRRTAIVYSEFKKVRAAARAAAK